MTWPSWTLWLAATVLLLFIAHQSFAPFTARVKSGQRNARADGLDIIHDPVNPQFEIVAVHGLGAHPEHTWEGKSTDKVKPRVHLLRDLLPRAFPTARIMSFSYNSDWLDKAFRLPIIFIGHSFGGIVIKQALCVMGLSSSTLEDTCGIIFLGTPHQGSSLSIAASLLGKLTALLGSNTALLLTLQSNHNQLSDLEDDFRRIAADKHITSLYETKPMFFLGFSIGCIVNRESARGYSKDPISIDTDHAGLNKFDGPDHPGFREIKTVIEKLRAKPLIQQADDVLLEKHYASKKLTIKRLSGEELSMDQCYINLVIVEQVQAKTPQDFGLEAKNSAPKPSPFSLVARLNIESSSDHGQVRLKDLFSRRKNSDGKEISPRRVLIRGHAGVGKTTLCKKMVHEFVRSGMWRDLFDRVLWVPLRNLKERLAPGYNLERLFFDEFFRLEGNNSGKLFATEMRKGLKHNRTLFILDGWDEVSQLAVAGSDMSRFLCDELLYQPNVVITSRPYANIPVHGQPIDLELETIGFSPIEVVEYIEKTHDKTDAKKVDEIKVFLQHHELVRSLVRVPIQLDALCYCWSGDNYSNKKIETMTALYQAIQTSLRRKDIPRLGEEHRVPTTQTTDLKDSDQVLIERGVKEEIRFLEHLAFDGLVADRLEFDWGDINRIWATEITHDNIRSPGNTLPCLSFLRTSDLSAKSVGQTYHFIHLTFQEYFAARYFARHWSADPSVEFNQQGQEPITPRVFFQKHKYNGRYDVVWRFVTGLLDEKGKEGSFFEEIELGPVDVLGPTHQRLVIHCLKEALKLPEGLRRKREDKLLQWVLFERELTGSSTFVRESELPEKVLRRALATSGDKTGFLDGLNASQRQLSDVTMAALVDLFKDEDSYVRESAAYALGNQSTLSDATIAALVGLLEDEYRNVRRSAADALGKQSTLSDATMAALVDLFKDEDSDEWVFSQRRISNRYRPSFVVLKT
ncbi:NACHT, LRR and PYD domains-containing protein 10 [Colletotrichum fructicola]|nr:NACHT, LRR and PYD domains-containing protein 10 [Colletotrichum fructicola]